MEYSSGQLGRVFVAAFNDGEDLLAGLRELAEREGVEAAMVMVLGALKGGRMVLGPRETVLPPEPMWQTIAQGHEIAALGTIFREEGKVKLHLHGGVGRAEKNLTGCLREDCKVFLTCEAVLLEIKGSGAHRVFWGEWGLSLLKLPKREA